MTESATSVGEPCEGGCGHLVRSWRGQFWTVVGPGEDRPTPRVLTDSPHTPGRCRAIRALREADRRVRRGQP